MSAPSVPPLVEKTSARYTAQLVDETGAGVPAASLTTLTLTLYDLLSGTILNSRNGQDVKNNHGVTIDVNGNLVWTLDPADTAIINDDLAIETHIALFQATWNSGAKACNHEVALPVRNLSKVT